MIRFSHELYSFDLFSFFVLIYTIDENNKQFNPIANLAHRSSNQKKTPLLNIAR